jgi:hypothetical protein
MGLADPVRPVKESENVTGHKLYFHCSPRVPTTEQCWQPMQLPQYPFIPTVPPTGLNLSKDSQNVHSGSWQISEVRDAKIKDAQGPFLLEE